MTEAVSRSIEGGGFPGEQRYVPPRDSAVASEVLAKVFADQPLPFATNPDGSVDTSIYLAWLTDVWREGMEAFAGDATVAHGSIQAAA
ncbi:hypothetical protein [Paracidovorax citrulli]